MAPSPGSSTAAPTPNPVASASTGPTPDTWVSASAVTACTAAAAISTGPGRQPVEQQPASGASAVMGIGDREEHRGDRPGMRALVVDQAGQGDQDEAVTGRDDRLQADGQPQRVPWGPGGCPAPAAVRRGPGVPAGGPSLACGRDKEAPRAVASLRSNRGGHQSAEHASTRCTGGAWGCRGSRRPGTGDAAARETDVTRERPGRGA